MRAGQRAGEGHECGEASGIAAQGRERHHDRCDLLEGTPALGLPGRGHLELAHPLPCLDEDVGERLLEIGRHGPEPEQRREHRSEVGSGLGRSKGRRSLGRGSPAEPVGERPVQHHGAEAQRATAEFGHEVPRLARQ